MLIVIIKVKKFLERYEEELQKTNKKELRVEKVIQRKGNKVYFELEG